MSFGVVDYEESGRKHACWLKSHSPGKMDRLVPLDEFIEQSIQDSNSAQAEEIDRLWQAYPEIADDDFVKDFMKKENA